MINQNYDLIAACAFGLESLVRRELSGLGIDARIGESGRVHFQGDCNTIVAANLWLRTADRVLIRVADFPAADFDALFETTRDLPWGSLIPSDANFPVTGRSIKSQLSSVPACQRTVKRAIVDALRRDHGTEELPETGSQYKVDIALLKDVATVRIDTTGRSLHRRGYRTDISKAPLKETLAAAMVMLSFWKAGKPLIDPFCGSGTIPIEAARIGRNMAPGRNRQFACQDWPNFPQTLWQTAFDAADAAITGPLEERIVASDIDERILRAARDNAARAGVADDIHFHALPMQQLSSKRRFGSLITNPPYGKRVGRNEAAEPNRRDDWELEQLYESFPEVLRKLPTWSHFILTSFPGFERTVGRQADRRRKLYNGRIECTFFQFHGPKPVLGSVPKSDSAEPAPEPEAQRAGISVDSEQPTFAPIGKIKYSTKSTKPNDGYVETLDVPSTTTPDPPTPPAAKPYVHAAGPPAFGQLELKADVQAELFAVRLKKRAKHLRRWPTKRGITCFRLYERDIPEIPLVVDQYEDHLHITEYERPHERSPAQHANWLDLMADTAANAIGVSKQNTFMKSRRRQRGKTQHEKVDNSKRLFEVHEGGLKFLVNLADYVDTGLFLDHRLTRSMVREISEGKHFLNLFAYTGSFSVYAAAGGAKSTTSVDLSKSYLEWAEQNMKLNGFSGDQHRFVRSDVGNYLKEHPAGQKYDVVVYDPPTFSNSKRTETDWNVQVDAVPLLIDLLPLVRTGGVIYFSTNFRRFKFESDVLAVSQVHEISNQTVPEDFRNRRIHRCWRIEK